MAKRVYVGNLNIGTTPEELLELFDSFEPAGATIISDPAGVKKGFGLIDLPEHHLSAAIQATDGQMVRGSKVVVNQRLILACRQGGGSTTDY